MYLRIFDSNLDLDFKPKSLEYRKSLTRNFHNILIELNKLALVTIIILIFNLSINNIKCQSGRFNSDDKSKKMNEASQFIFNRLAHTQKDYLMFLNKIDGFDAKNVCPTLTQSDLQAKIKKFKSIISECPGYKVCKLGMRQNGSIYGELDPRLETVLNITEVHDNYFIKQTSLFGAHYIKFVYADKYLCINKQQKLSASNLPKKECLWYTNKRPITSAFNKEISLQFQSTQRECKVSASLSDSKVFEQSQMHGSFKKEKCGLKIDIANLLDIYSMTKNCFNFNFEKSATKQKLNSKKLIKTIITTTKIPTSVPKTTNTPTTISIKQKFQNEKIFKQSTKIIKENYFKKPEKDQINLITKHKKENFSGHKNLLSEIKTLCSNYFQGESNNKKIDHFDYIYSAILSKSSKLNSNDLSGLCSEIKSLINVSESFNDQIEAIFINNPTSNLINRKTNIDYFNYYYNSAERIYPTTESSFLSTTSFLNSSKFKYKKCYEYRNTAFYKECMNIHYKCYQYNNDIENLKKCRRNKGITLPTRKYNIY